MAESKITLANERGDPTTITLGEVHHFEVGSLVRIGPKPPWWKRLWFWLRRRPRDYGDFTVTKVETDCITIEGQPLHLKSKLSWDPATNEGELMAEQTHPDGDGCELTDQDIDNLYRELYGGTCIAGWSVLVLLVAVAVVCFTIFFHLTGR